MLDLAVAGNPRLAVERIELTLPVPSYTVRTLQALAGREPGNRFTLLLGADAAAELAAWYQVEALPALADVVVFSRDRKSTRLNSSHGYISYAVFCLKKKKS